MESVRNLIHLPLAQDTASSLTLSPPKGKPVKQSHLINRINFFNFTETPLKIRLRHKTFPESIITIEAIPGPCYGDTVTCQWLNMPTVTIDNYSVDHILIPDEQKAYLVHAVDAQLTASEISFRVPASCAPVEIRHSKRMKCEGITAKVIQNSSSNDGILADINSEALRVVLDKTVQAGTPWWDKSESTTVILSSTEHTVYLGQCSITGLRGKNLVLTPTNNSIRRFAPRNNRSNRVTLTPSPHVIFTHPLTQQLWDLKAVNISGTGFKVEVDSRNSPLFPGLVLPHVEIAFGSTSLKCKCQVIHRTIDVTGNPETTYFGISILDMDQESHLHLMSILQQETGKKTYLNPKIDMQALWSFFFETGFIYPEKYITLAEHKGSFKSIYDRLYNNRPSIAHHFISQDKGTILGHLSMLRFYQNTWVVHHHTANKVAGKHAGLDVLKQANSFINETHRLSSANMNYILCYFRPDNKFPRKIFGGAAKSLGNPKHCSVDMFAYFILSKTDIDGSWNCKSPTTLKQASKEDLNELVYFYKSVSNGLFLEAIQAQESDENFHNIRLEFQAVGLTRRRHEYSLIIGTKTAAIVYFDISDSGLNMSGLTTAFTVFIIDETLPIDNLLFVLKLLESKYKQMATPVMVYPSTYIESQATFSFKHYQAWCLNVEYFDRYLEFFQDLLARNSAN